MSDARTLALRVITRVFDEGAYADRAFTGEAEKAQVDARDRALAMHLAFGTVQRRRTLDAALEDIAGRPVQRLERKLAHVLQLGVFQILFADGIPPHAAVSESVELARRVIGPRATGSRTRCCAASRPRDRSGTRPCPRRRPRTPRCATRCPTGSPRSGSGPTARSGGGRCAPPPTRRPRSRCGRTRCCDGEARVAAWLAEAGPWPCATTPPACCASTGRSTSPARRRSRAARSSPSRARPCWSRSASAPQPGMRVLDLCAAPGGKTAVLAASGAQVTAVDAHPARAKALAATLRRLAVGAEVVAADGRAYRGGPFDRILVDAPCSGLGVLAGRPDARWRRTPEDADELAALQAELVTHARRCSRRAASCTTRSARSTRRRTRTSRPPPASSRTTSCAPGPTRATTASTRRGSPSQRV